MLKLLYGNRKREYHAEIEQLREIGNRKRESKDLKLADWSYRPNSKNEKDKINLVLSEIPKFRDLVIPFRMVALVLAPAMISIDHIFEQK